MSRRTRAKNKEHVLLWNNEQDPEFPVYRLYSVVGRKYPASVFWGAIRGKCGDWHYVAVVASSRVRRPGYKSLCIMMTDGSMHQVPLPHVYPDGIPIDRRMRERLLKNYVLTNRGTHRNERS